jgi:MFS family permease
MKFRDQRPPPRTGPQQAQAGRLPLVVAAFIVQAIAVGNQYLTSILLEPLRLEVGVSYSTILLATTGLALACGGLFAPFIGRLLLTYSARSIIILSVILTGCGYLLLGVINNIWEVIVIYACLMAAANSGGLISSAALITQAFDKKRGLFLGLAASGTSVMGFTLPPLVAFLLHSYGLGFACTTVAILALASAPLLWILARARPADRALAIPKNGVDAETGPTVHHLGVKGVIDFFMQRRFLLVVGSSIVCSSAVSALGINLAPIARVSGIGAVSAALLVSCMAASAVISKLVCGYVYDLAAPRWGALIPNIAFLAGCWLLVDDSSPSTLAAASVFIGAGIGGATILPAYLSAFAFSESEFSLAYGLVAFTAILVTELNLAIFGGAVDRSGVYTTALEILMFELCAAIIFIVSTRTMWIRHLKR